MQLNNCALPVLVLQEMQLKVAVIQAFLIQMHTFPAFAALFLLFETSVAVRNILLSILNHTNSCPLCEKCGQTNLFH